MDLRSRAEAAMEEKAIDHPDVSTLPTKELQALVNELQVHQIELEMQNDGLKRVQLALEEARDKYQDLYDFSPVGYFTLTHNGIIREANLTGAILLGTPRTKLINMCFGRFVASDSDNQWYRHIISALGHVEKQTCFLTLKRDDGSSFYARLESIRMDAPAEPQRETDHRFIIRIAVSDITERQRMGKALLESEENYRLLAENTQDVIWRADLDLVFTYVNPAIVRLTGYTPEEWIGTSLEEHCDQENFIKLAQVVSAAISKGPGSSEISVEAALLDKNREPVPIEVRANILYGVDGSPIALQGVTRDITERKKAEKALLESEQRYRSLFEGSRDGVIFTDMEGQIKAFNTAYREMLGYTSEELFSQTYKDLTPTQWVAIEDRIVSEQIIPRGYSDTYEKEYIGKDGRLVPIELNTFIIQKDGINVGMWATVRDISERKRLEAERFEMEMKLLHAQKLESLGAMAGGIAHDFNNLLMAIMCGLDFALDDPALTTKTRSSIETAMLASEKSAELSRQMLIYSGSGFYSPSDLDLGEVAHKNVDLFKSVIPKTTTLHFEINEGLPLTRGDADQIERIITNLVLNASESIGDNTGEVTIGTGVMDCDEAYLSFSRLEQRPEPGGFVFLEVRDTGCGMDAETQRKLFDPFFTTKFWGRGLGMAEVMGTVKGHHGAIIVESEVGKGTTIRVLFPVPKEVQAKPVQVIDAVDSKAPASGSVSSRKTILVVDDEELVRGMILMRLDVLGYDTIPAVDGAEGVHLFRERFNDIDLVLLDFAMPRMNGVEAFEKLIKVKPDVKVILSSAYTENMVAKSFSGPKPAGFLNKPYKLEVLKAEIERLLGTNG